MKNRSAKEAWFLIVPVCGSVGMAAYYLTTMPIGEALFLLTSLTVVSGACLYGDKISEFVWYKASAQQMVQQIEAHLANPHDGSK